MLAGFVALLAQSSAPEPRPYTTWTHPNGSADALQYSALDQINKQNVSQLQQVWFYPVPGETGRFGFSPLIANDMMYVLGKDNAIVALDAATGKEIWSHPVEGTPTARGINYWQSKDGTDRRLFFGAQGNLQAIDARTGKPILSFGDNGLVNMREGDFRPLGGPSSTPGRVFENLLIVGSGAGEGYDASLGDIRAYNVQTGKLVWTFHTIPRPGEFGYDTWPKEAYKNVGNVGSANVWGEISVDEKRGIVYLPTGSAAYDFYGGERIGADLFADCLLALDARTGKRLWYFQAVHHDLWDYDLTTAPKLLTVRHNGKWWTWWRRLRNSASSTCSTGLRESRFGQSRNGPCPPVTCPASKPYPTQPFPTNPPPFARAEIHRGRHQSLHRSKDKERLRDILLHARNEGLFTPPAMHNTIDMPGELGGANWGGVAGDPETGMLYVRSIDAPTMHILSNSPRVTLIEGRHTRTAWPSDLVRRPAEPAMEKTGPALCRQSNLENSASGICSPTATGKCRRSNSTPGNRRHHRLSLNDPAAGALPQSAGRAASALRRRHPAASITTRPTAHSTPKTVCPPSALRGRRSLPTI